MKEQVLTFLKKYKLWIILGTLACIAGVIGGAYYVIFSAALKTDKYELLIPTGSTYKYVEDKLLKDKVLKDPNAFILLAKQMGYPEKVMAGRYVLTKYMSNKDIISTLRNGSQTPVKFTFVKFRTKADIIKKLKGKFEFAPEKLVALMDNNNFLKDYGLTNETSIAFFIPNTYEIKWNKTPEEFFNRMRDEYNDFWSEKRNKKCEKLGLSRLEVMALASIVEEETNKNDEKQRIAGVYLNRLRIGKELQADPTVKFAVGDFGLRRILYKHLATDSPYNTYKNKGLPPGPICTPSVPSIDAVLDAEEHKYLYFCAKEDFSGYHTFAVEYDDHLANAKRYQKALDELKQK